ncbi:MAG TPA: signal peptidase I [Tepidisphaeraceae bacterium]|jgi:signal peptidase I
MRAALILTTIQFGMLVLSVLLVNRGNPGLAFSIALLLVQLVATLSVSRWLFRLTFARALAPFGAGILLAILEVVFLLLAVRPHVLEAFVVPTASMSPTIVPGTRIVVDKLLTPRRWDIVAYWQKDYYHPSIYCKRLVGLPGERLRFEQGNLYVDDRLVQAPPVVAGRYKAANPQLPSRDRRYREGESFTLGADEFFVIGDAVDISADSRIYGPSPGSAIVGVVDVIYWPLNMLRVLR